MCIRANFEHCPTTRTSWYTKEQCEHQHNSHLGASRYNWCIKIQDTTGISTFIMSINVNLETMWALLYNSVIVIEPQCSYMIWMNICSSSQCSLMHQMAWKYVDVYNVSWCTYMMYVDEPRWSGWIM